MKRFFSMIMAVCAFIAASAQTPMVTLSHNGELSFFTDTYALNSAVDSAQNGDVLYLSEGSFPTDGGYLFTRKRLSIVGSGYRSHILGHIRIDMSENPDYYIGAPLFDGVRLDKLQFDFYGYKENLIASEITRCWIQELEGGANAGMDAIYDKCKIDKATFSGSGKALVKNSKITGTYNDSFYNITAINCNISKAAYYPQAMISCIVKNDGNGPTAGSTISIVNSVIDFIPSGSDVYAYDCYRYTDENVPLLDENMDCPLDLNALGYFGEDGTVVGINGGLTPFSENPSLPTVDSANSSVEYDATGNKLKVSITVKAD